MSVDNRVDELDISKIKEYAQNASRVGSAIESLRRHDGWQIFLALYKRRKETIKETNDYADITDFRADRKALDIIDEIFTEMEGFISDADEATKQLVGISSDDTPRERGIMLIEAMEDVNREG